MSLVFKLVTHGRKEVRNIFTLKMLPDISETIVFIVNNEKVVKCLLILVI